MLSADKIDTLTDEQLMLLMRHGDVDALGEFYDRHYLVLIRAATRWLADSESAEDLVQDVFLEAWKNIRSYDPAKTTPKGWFILRLRSRALDRLKTTQRHDRLNALYDFLTSNRPMSGHDIDIELIRTHMQCLSDVQRDVVDAIYFRGEQASEASARFGIPLSTVKSRLASALTKLRESIGVANKPDK